VSAPRVINIDKNQCYSGAVKDLKADKLLPESCQRKARKYMNDLVEQDHWFIKRRVSPGLKFSSFPTAWRTLQGYKTINMIQKGQNDGVEQGNIRAQNRFIASLFGLKA